jgi:hypothetical protein
MSVGTNNSTDGLVFGYDTGSDTSYLGEPTTNLVPDAANNGRFTINNSWATYNTNQYCGNNGCGTYWTIPSISSVSGNVVTTSSAHQIRSFDVIQPNATGGGVNNGQNYVAKKISDTQFCLYLYNGSQGGADGYINPTTGFYKVHDDYANDNKVSISASGFPTGWWGAPHLPNAGLIKEIVSGGGRVPGTDCMRWHQYRGDEVADGMAYGVYVPVTAGDTITVSYYLRAATKSAVGKTGSYTTYFYGYGAFGAGFSWGAHGEWVRNVHQWTASYTSSFYQYWFPQGSGDPYAVDIADLQVEVNKGHATKFTTGTRSATQSLIDMTRQRTIDVSTLSFDASGLPFFDGTNDYLNIGSINLLALTNSTLEAVIYMNNLSSPHDSYNIFGGYSSEGYHGYHEIRNSGSGYKMTYWTSANGWRYANTSLSAGTWYHVAWVWEGTTLRWYLNGVADGSYTFSTFSPYGLGINSIGYFPNERYMNGKIPVAKVYNRALSASEINTHYYSYKTRFGLS